MIPLTKNFNPEDYKELAQEVEFIDGVLSKLEHYSLNHEHRKWEYAMALRAIKSVGIPYYITKVLDAGSGASPFPLILHEAGYDVECVDRIDRPKAQRNWWWQPVWHNVDHKFKRAEYDFVTAIGVIEHVKDDDDMLERWWAIANSGMFITYDSSSDGRVIAPDIHYRTYTVEQMVAKTEKLSHAYIFMGTEETYYGDNVVTPHGACSFGSLCIARSDV